MAKLKRKENLNFQIAKKERDTTIVAVSLLILTAAIVVMAVWVFGISRQTIGWRYLGLKFNTAFCLFMLGGTLLLTQYPVVKYTKPFLIILPVAVIIISGLSLSEYLFHINTGIDEFFIRETTIFNNAYPIPGRMSFNTSVDLLLLSLGLFFLQIDAGNLLKIVGQYLFHIVAILAAIGLIGYIYSVSLYHSVLSVEAMDLHTSAMFFMLSVAALLLNPSIGIIKLFLGRQIGDKAARRIFVIIVVLVLLYGSARLQVQRTQIFPIQLTVAVMIVCFLLAMLIVLWSVAQWMNKLDNRRTKAEQEVKVLNAGLEKRVAERSAEIQKKEERYRLLIEQASDAIYVVDLEGNFLDVNNRICQMTGYSRDELLTMNVRNIIDPEELKIDPLPSGLGRISPIIRERTIRRIDGTTFVTEVNVKKFDDNMVLVIARDITERKQAEKKLLESEERYRLLFYNSPLPKLVYDIESFRIVDVNDIAIRAYGYSREEFLNLTIHDLRPGGGMPLIPSLLKGIGDGQRINHFGIHNHQRKDGTIIKADVAGYRLNYQGIDCMMVVCNDVTEREKAVEKLKELNSSLKKQARELEISNSELEQFAYVASHDLQEPLRMITGFLTRLESKYGDSLGEKGKQYIYFATDGAKRMRQLILDLLQFSRIGRVDAKMEAVDFNKLINEALILCSEPIRELNARIDCIGLPQLNTYKTPMLQVFQNLISNSLKYHTPGLQPVIEIACKETSSEFEFSVRDNGIGISSEFFEKIFVVFQRLHNKDEYSGTGMGLAITKKIIENIGGRIWVKSAEGMGSTFYFTVPKNS